MKARFIKSAHEGSNIWTFYFNAAQPLDYIAGQFIELTIPLPENSEDKNKRWFTLSSSPTEPHLSITTRIYEKFRSDFKTALKDLKPSDEVDISQAMGDFVLPKNTNTKLVFIAGGIGITPYRSIIKSLRDSDETDRKISLIHRVSSPSDLVFSKLFTSFACEYQSTQEKLSAMNIGELVKELADSTIYISGPEEFVEKLRDEFLLSSIPEHKVIGDYFPGYPETRKV